MTSVADIISKANSERIQDRPWRAREIVAGNLHAFKYSKWASEPDVLELYFYYGGLLVELGDMMEGGKYFFLSGKRDTSTDLPIGIFTERLIRVDPMNLYRALPKRAKLNSISLYPHKVQQYFQSLNMPENLYQASGVTVRSGLEPTEEQRKQWRRRERISLVAVCLLLLLPWVVGTVCLLWYIFSWVSSTLLLLFA